MAAIKASELIGKTEVKEEPVKELPKKLPRIILANGFWYWANAGMAIGLGFIALIVVIGVFVFCGTIGMAVLF